MRARSRQERLDDFLRRLKARRAASSQAEALGAIAETLNAIEDQTDIPYNPATRGDDGRMYPPQDDAKRPTKRADVVRYRTRGHNIFIRANGAIEIRNVKSDALELDKPGADGRRVSDP